LADYSWTFTYASNQFQSMFTKLSKNSSMRVIVRFYNVSISVHMNIIYWGC